MKKGIVCLAALLTALLPMASSQEDSKVGVQLYGFVRNYFNFDSRQTYTVIGGEYNMIPFDRQLQDGVDLNAVPQAQLQALTTRVGLDLKGPELWGMQSSGKVEGDFGGFGATNSVFRIRQAYVKLMRQRDEAYSELLIGQTWHPLSGDIMPEVLGMATGAPFRPHSRTPQVRDVYYWGHFGYTAALLYQLQYMNNGPTSATDPTSTSSIAFANKALIPEVFFGVNFKSGAWYAQVGFDEQMLRPRTHAVGSDGVVRKVDERVWSLTPTVYAQYVGGLWSVKLRTLLAENTSHLNQLVGYAVSGVNADGSWTYVPLRSSISYFNIAYGHKVRANLFLGYMKNLGATVALHDFDQDLATPTGTAFYRIYMKGGETFTGLNSVWRVSPSVSYNVKAFNIGLEYELTGTTYGAIGSHGNILNDDQLHSVVNHRVCALVKYNF